MERGITESGITESYKTMKFELGIGYNKKIRKLHNGNRYNGIWYNIPTNEEGSKHLPE